jgi:hypothetical protein
MGKVTVKGLWKDSDPRWQEGWTIAVSLGLKEQVKPGKPPEQKAAPLTAQNSKESKLKK